MIVWLISLVTGLGVPPRLAKPVLAVAGALLLGLALWGAVKLHDRRVIRDHQVQIERRAQPATDKAADERANDAITNAKHEEEAHSAIHSVPDAAPAAPSHELACERLRRRGNAPASCGRP